MSYSVGTSQLKPFISRCQKGLSLVELMVSVVLGSLVVIAAVSILQTNQRTFELQRQMTEVQESGRFAVDYIARDLRRLGVTHEDSALPLPAGVLFGVAGSADDSTLAGGNDQLAFEFYGAIDCEGDTALGAVTSDPATWVLIRNFYDVRQNAAGENELFCEGSVDPNTNGAALVQGVDSFQVLYGLDGSVDGSDRVDNVLYISRYVRADEVDPAVDYVTAVRIGLLIRTLDDNVAELADSGGPSQYVVLDKVLTVGNAPLDEQRIRRLFVSTVVLRNVEWTEI